MLSQTERKWLLGRKKVSNTHKYKLRHEIKEKTKLMIKDLALIFKKREKLFKEKNHLIGFLYSDPSIRKDLEIITKVLLETLRYTLPLSLRRKKLEKKIYEELVKEIMGKKL